MEASLKTDIEIKIDKTVEWLREKVKEANCKGLAVGGFRRNRFSSSCLSYKESFPR